MQTPAKIRNMKKVRAILLSYAAGIMDGEGSITLHHNNPRGLGRSSETWYPRLIVKMNDGKPLDLLRTLFGGTTDIVHDLRDGIFPSFTWEISSGRAASAAKQMLPFLRTKKRQAELIIRYQSRVDVGKRKIYRRGNPMSVHEVEARRNLALELKRLNADNIHIPKSGLTTEQEERAKALMRQSKLIGKEQ